MNEIGKAYSSVARESLFGSIFETEAFMMRRNQACPDLGKLVITERTASAVQRP